MRSRISMGVALLFLCAPAFAQTSFEPNGEGVNLIQQKLGAGDRTTLRMGWLIPPNRVVLETQNPEAHVYSNSKKTLIAKYIGPLDKEAAEVIRSKHCMVCEPDGKYFQYQVEGLDIAKAERVLVTLSPLPDAKLGFGTIKVKRFFLSKAASILGAEKGLLHRSLYLRTLDGKFTYSFHAFYDPRSKDLKRSGMILEKRGVLLAKESRSFDLDHLCDGCGIPAFEDPFDHVYLPLNLIETSALPCPLILLDTSTVEGRALSLVTFDMEGLKSEVRSYEYVVHCCK